MENQMNERNQTMTTVDDDGRIAACAWARDEGSTLSPCSTCEWGSLCKVHEIRQDKKTE